MNNPTDEQLQKVAVSQPPARKSRSISRYFLGNKRSSINSATQNNHDIYRCLISVGIFDSYDLWAHVTLFRDYTTCRRLFIVTSKNELIIGKYNHRHVLFKIKQRIDLNRVWLHTQFNDHVASEVTSLNYYDLHRSFILGWPFAENFVVEFEARSIRESWREHIESTLRLWRQLNRSAIEHVRVVIDQNSELDQNNNTPSFLIRKVIGVRPEETVHDLIRKCIDAFHLQDPIVDNYVLLATNDPSNGLVPSSNLHVYGASSQLSQITNIPLIGHEHPYSVKMKHPKMNNTTHANHLSFDGDDSSSYPMNQHSSTSSLTTAPTPNYHDFELRKRDISTDNPTRKYRFFPKRKTKTQQQLADSYYSSSTPYLSSPSQSKPLNSFFGLSVDELMLRHNHQLPPVLMQLLENLYFKGPETTGVFRKVANTRSVRDCIEKIERNTPIEESSLHPILAAGLFKHFLRTLPDPLFTSTQYSNFKRCLRLSMLLDKISFARKSIFSTLSTGNHLLLKGFLCALHRIAEHADVNGMNAFNLGLCVSNSLFKTETNTIRSGKQEADVMSSVVEFLIHNCSALFGSDILTCIPDKRIIVHEIPNLLRPTASSIESLDEVESSPHLPLVSRSHDSGLAASDPPFNDDSSEISEQFRRTTTPLPTPATPDWTSSIACGTGVVITSIVTSSSNPIVTAVSVTRRRSSKNAYKPSRQFLEREKFTTNTTDDSDNNSSMRSSATTIHNITVGKIKRSKSLSRHSSLGSAEHRQQPKPLTKESRRLTATTDVKRTSSLKQFDRVSDDDADDDDGEQKTKNLTNSNKTLVASERRIKGSKSKSTTMKKTTEDECTTIRSSPSEQQDLDLTTEPLSTINQRLSNSSLSIASRSSSFASMPTSSKLEPSFSQTSPSISSQQQSRVADSRSRHHNPLTLTTNRIHLISQSHTHLDHAHASATNHPQKSGADRGRTFVRHSNSRSFVLGEAIPMKPIDESILVTDKRRPYHRQDALECTNNEQDRPARVSESVIINHNPTGITRYQSIERRIPPPPQPIKSFSFDFSNDVSLSDHTASTREKGKFFEHTQQHKLSTGRENYV